MAMQETPKTDRGLRRIEFLDFYSTECSIQESSLATAPALWLGLDEDCGRTRMHLTQERARWLAGLLTAFAETGNLPDAHESPPSPPDDDPTQHPPLDSAATGAL